jgi:transposase
MKSKVLDGIERILARASKRVVSFVGDDNNINVKACSTVRSAPCPDCQSWSNRRHGSYVRCLAERPSLEQQVVIFVQIHRFKCPRADCPRRTFAEDIQSLAGRHHRRTRSHARALQALGHALGGAAAVRLAANLGIHASADTVLREVRRAGMGKQRVPPQVVGIDDWAIARGVNLRAHRAKAVAAR